MDGSCSSGIEHATVQTLTTARKRGTERLVRVLRELGHILPTGIEAKSKFATGHGAEEKLEVPKIADGIPDAVRHLSSPSVSEPLNSPVFVGVSGTVGCILGA